MEKGCSSAGTKNGIEIKKEQWKVQFETKFVHPNCYVFGVTTIPDRKEEIACVAKHKAKDYMKAHQLLGHRRDKLLGTCERMHWNLSNGHPNACEDCLIAKDRRMILNRESKTDATKAGEKIMIDISSVKINDKKSTKRFWLLVLDEATDM